MFNKKVSKWIMISTVGSLLLGCGSDSDDTSSEDVAYIQYYNASPDSSFTALALDDYLYSAVDFADATPRYTRSTGTTEIDVYGQDADGETVVIYNGSVELTNTERHLFVLLGEYETPSLLDINYSRVEMDELNADENNEYSKMQVLVANVATQKETFDAYISLDTQTIDDAVMLGNISYGSYTTAKMFDTDDYIVYLTETGTKDILYTSASMDLNIETVNKLIIRNSFGSGALKVTIDNVDASTTPVNYSALEATADVRVFNGLESQPISLDISSNQEAQYLYDINSFSVTDYQSMSYNDYGVTIRNAITKEKLFDNLLVTFNQDEIKTILVYQEEDEVKGMVIEPDLRPRAYEYQVDLVNLASNLDGLTVYFVRDSETIETVKYKLTDLDFEEKLTLTLPQDDYEINIVYKADNGTQTLIYQSALISLNGQGHYTFVLTPDTVSSFGYRLTLL